MDIVTKEISQDEIDKFAEVNKQYLPIEQMPIWQNFDNAVSNRHPVGLFGFYSKDTLLGFAYITEYLNSKYKWWWAKHGPVFANATTKTQKKQILEVIKDMAKKNTKNIIFVRLTIPELGLKLSDQLQHMMYDKTLVIDLKMADNDKILTDMTRHGRYEVRKSLKNGVQCQKLSNSEAINNFDKYYKIINETAERDGFFALPKKTYIAMLETLGDNVSFYLATYKASPVAWAIVTSYNKYSKYYYAAGNKVAREVGAAYALQYFILKDLRDNGIESYDLMGIASDDWPDIANVTNFKKKFTHNTVNLDKTYDMVCSPTRYKLLKVLKRTKKVLAR